MRKALQNFLACLRSTTTAQLESVTHPNSSRTLEDCRYSRNPGVLVRLIRFNATLKGRLRASFVWNQPANPIDSACPPWPAS